MKVVLSIGWCRVCVCVCLSEGGVVYWLVSCVCVCLSEGGVVYWSVSCVCVSQ